MADFSLLAEGNATGIPKVTWLAGYSDFALNGQETPSFVSVPDTVAFSILSEGFGTGVPAITFFGNASLPGVALLLMQNPGGRRRKIIGGGLF